MADSENKGIAVTAELKAYLVEHSTAQPSVNAELVEATKEAIDS